MRASAVRGVAAVLLTGYALVIARLTLLPASSESSTFAALNDAVTWLSNGGLTWTQIEVVANVALFVPAGFLLAVVTGRRWAAVLCCASASGAIEGAQQLFLATRVPSLADIEHNTLGGLIGALLAWSLVRWLQAAPAARQPVMPVSAPSRMR